MAFDSNFRPALWEDRQTAQFWVSKAWDVTTIALPSLDDEIALFEEKNESAVLQRLKASGIKRGAIKRGQHGPLAISGADAGPFPAAEKIVDTTAAGDSFNGAYLGAVLTGATEEAALQSGHARALATIARIGAITPR